MGTVLMFKPRQRDGREVFRVRTKREVLEAAYTMTITLGWTHDDMEFVLNEMALGDIEDAIEIFESNFSYHAVIQVC